MRALAKIVSIKAIALTATEFVLVLITTKFIQIKKKKVLTNLF